MGCGSSRVHKLPLFSCIALLDVVFVRRGERRLACGVVAIVLRFALKDFQVDPLLCYMYRAAGANQCVVVTYSKNVRGQNFLVM